MVQRLGVLQCIKNNEIGHLKFSFLDEMRSGLYLVVFLITFIWICGLFRKRNGIYMARL